MSKSKTPSNIGGFIAVDKETLLEIDYMDTLSPEDRAWYERFLDNEINARFHKDGLDVVIDREDQKAANRCKQRRLKDFTNQMIPTDGETPEQLGRQILTPKAKVKRKSKKKKAPKQVKKSASPDAPVETIEEYLARNGQITKIPNKN